MHATTGGGSGSPPSVIGGGVRTAACLNTARSLNRGAELLLARIEREEDRAASTRPLWVWYSIEASIGPTAARRTPRQRGTLALSACDNPSAITGEVWPLHEAYHRA